MVEALGGIGFLDGFNIKNVMVTSIIMSIIMSIIATSLDVDLMPCGWVPPE